MAPGQKTGLATQDVLAFAFAPIHKAAFGAAVGLVLGLLTFALTVLHLVLVPPEALNIGLLSQYFFGYKVSWAGAFIGLGWGTATGFVLGWFAAFMRNLVVSIGVFALKTKAELKRTADFLDHI
jgi:hypothetical protein